MSLVDGRPAAPGVPSENAAPPVTSLGYKPGLDGLRGLALLAIVVYHSGLTWMPGAFLSVSTFFTLSGFLITAVMLGEHAKRGHVSLKNFWARRVRRLVPAALVAVAGIIAASYFLADNPQLARLRGDGLASLFYVANWRFIALGDSYGEQFTSPSPFTHFWTLGIEEQFYVVFPLLFVGTMVLAKGNRRALAAVLGVLTTASVAWAAFLLHRGSSLDRIYFGTDTRAAELFTGALLAIWWLRRPDPLGSQGRRVVRMAGVVAMGMVVVLWAVARLDQRFYYQGGLALYSLLTLVVVLAAMQEGIVARVLAFRPLVKVGMVSYGAYLFHWPIFVWLDIHTGLAPAARLAVGLPATLLLAALSYKLVEEPIRTRNKLGPDRFRYLAPLAVAATFVLIVVVAAQRPAEQQYDFGSALAAAQGNTAADRERLAAKKAERAEMAATGAPLLSIYGDSTALLTGLGLSEWADRQYETTGKATFVPSLGYAQLGCGLVAVGPRKRDGQVTDPPEPCAYWPRSWAAAAKKYPVDIAFVGLGTWDVLDQKPAGFDRFVSIGDPKLDALLRSQLETAVAALHGHAKLIVFALPPDNEIGRVDGRSPDQPQPGSGPERMGRFRQMVRDLAATHDDVATVDLARWLDNNPDERKLRPDGIHFTGDAAIETAKWLGPELVRVYDEWKQAQPTG